MDWKKNKTWLDLVDRYDFTEEKVGEITKDFSKFDLRKPESQQNETEKLYLKSGKDGQIIALHFANKYGLTQKQAGQIFNIYISKTAFQRNSIRQASIGVTTGRWEFLGAGRHPCKHASLNGKKFSLKDGLSVGTKRIYPGYEAGCMCSHSPITDIATPKNNNSSAPYQPKKLGIISRLKNILLGRH